MSIEYPSIQLHRKHIIILTLIVTWYLLATLPFLGDYPILTATQTGIAAPAYKLASEGIYGNDLYTGLHNSEIHNYEYMPLYPLAVAISYKILGLGVWQARIVSVLAGLATILLTFYFGMRLYDQTIGLLAAAFLCILSITVPVLGKGELYPGSIPLLDFARVIRYDIFVPVFVLLTSIFFFRANLKNSSASYFLAGISAGLASLSHLYGGLILVVLGIQLLLQYGLRAVRKLPGYLLIAGWLVTMLPWILYILQDYNSYQGQMLRHRTRFDFLDLNFYLSNMLREPWRYVRLLGSFRHPNLWPRVGFWVLIATLIISTVTLGNRIRRRNQINDQLTLLPTLVFGLLFASIVSFKRYAYMAVLIPFLSIQTALGVHFLIKWANKKNQKIVWVINLVIILVFIEGGYAVHRNLQSAITTTPYSEITGEVKDYIPADALVLALHDYWIGLANYNILALDLAFSLSEPEFGFPFAPPFKKVVEQIAPDYVVLREQLLKAYQRDPSSLPNEKIARKWQQLDIFLQATCFLAYTGDNDPDYGIVQVYHCTKNLH